MRALIIGIDGTIGRALGDALAADGATVYGTTRREASAAAGDRRIRLDLAAPNAADVPLPEVDVAVFCAAMARFADCREQPELTYRVNVATPLPLARRIVAAGARIVLLSTSAVFDGSLPHRREDDVACPTTAYGRLKAEAEAGFLGLGAAAAVLRLTKIVTPDMPLLAGWVAALSARCPVEAFADLRFCPLVLEDAVDALLAVIREGTGGVWHVSGSNDISYAEAARHLAKSHGADLRLVRQTRACEHGIPADEILTHTSLDTARLTALTGFRPPTPETVLDATFPPPLAAGHRLAASAVG